MNTQATDDCPLYVDLDGTLTPGDTLHESAMLFVRQHPLNLLRMLAWLPRGKAGFKRALADAVRPDPARLPWRADFIDFLRGEHARGRTLVLASAAEIKGFSQAAHLPLKRIRGQISRLPQTPASAELTCVVCAEGYVAPPRLGEHSDMIVRAAGFEPDALRAAGAIR